MLRLSSRARSVRPLALVPVVAAALAAAPAVARAQHAGHDADRAHGAPAIGAIRFDGGANPAARRALLEGLAYLHNFHYDEAALAFRRARRADPGLAPAAWGEALSHSHVFWGTEALDSSRAALVSLAPDAAARLALARTPSARAFGESVEAFYGAGALPERAAAFADAARRWASARPHDDEALAFAALATMMRDYAGGAPGAVHWSDTAATYAETLLARRPAHPGAAHYLTHAYDRPEVAARGIAAARAYERIAPDAEHALHMPSHIYQQVGDWPAMARSNERSWAASRGATRARVGTGAEGSPHSLEWLAYAYLQEGRIAAARALVDSARALQRRAAPLDAVTRPDAAHIVANVAWRVAYESGDWSGWDTSLEREPAELAAHRAGGGAPLSARAAGMAASRTFMALTAAVLARRDTAAAGTIVARSRTRPAAPPRQHWQAAQLEGLVARVRGDTGAAIDAFERAIATFDGAGASIPYGLVVQELLGELRLARGDAAGAVRDFTAALAVRPNRSNALLGLARAHEALGRTSAADSAWRRLERNWRRADASRRALLPRRIVASTGTAR